MKATELRSYRTARKVGVIELATALDWTPHLVSAIELGRVEVTDEQVLAIQEKIDEMAPTTTQTTTARA